MSLGVVTWPSTTSAAVQSFAYPDDGSAVRMGVSSSSAVAQPGPNATSHATVDAIAVSLFEGEISADQVVVRATAGASSRSAGADTSGPTVRGLRVLGQDVGPTPGSTVPLADWGTLQILAGKVERHSGAKPWARGALTALRVHLSADHGGLPAGTDITVGFVEATASPTGAGAAGGSGTPAPAPAPSAPAIRPPEPDPDATSIPGGPVRAAPPGVVAHFTRGGYVFPIFGPASFGDSFGGPRPDVPGGWHHGEDIFAPLGAPLLAVADGTLYSIGWNAIGGYRLWLRDAEGNQFYYAHLSAFAPLAVEGNRVRAGDVVGFVGNTGDADGGPAHLHFEIHPVAMLGLGYDGVVAPYPILLAWRRALDASFASGRIHVPAGTGGEVIPPPGAVLLEAVDIAGTSGLVPGALEAALEPRLDASQPEP